MNTNMGILGRKIGMTQIHDENGMCLPVTAIDAGPCRVIQVKTPENDGYSAIQIGFDEKPARATPDALVKKAQGFEVVAAGHTIDDKARRVFGPHRRLAP